MNTKDNKKDIWDKIQVLGVLFIPIVLSIYGVRIDSALKESEIRSKYIEISTGILRDKPSKDTIELRLWAIDVLQKYSLVPLSEKAINELKVTALPNASFLRDTAGNILSDTTGRPLTDTKGE